LANDVNRLRFVHVVIDVCYHRKHTLIGQRCDVRKEKAAQLKVKVTLSYPVQVVTYLCQVPLAKQPINDVKLLRQYLTNRGTTKFLSYPCFSIGQINSSLKQKTMGSFRKRNISLLLHCPYYPCNCKRSLKTGLGVLCFISK